MMTKLLTALRWQMLAMTFLAVVGFVACSDDDDVIVPTITIHSQALYILTPETTSTVRFTTSKAVSVSVTAMPVGWTVEANISTGIISVTSPKADDPNCENSGDVVIHAYSESGYTTSATLYISREEAVDLSEQRSNCYIITRADETFKIPVTRKGEGDEVITPASVGLVWQTPGSLLSFVDSFEEGFLSFHTIPDGDGNLQPGNALVAAYDEAGEVLWTWHLWMTDSAPEAIGRYMDRNLGANHTLHATHEEILQSYGTYYQWGRMTPFVPPATYNCGDSRDAYMYSISSAALHYITYEQTSSDVDPEWAVSHPLIYLLGSEESHYDWLYGSTDDLWSADKKSLYDPCPKGWRVAESLAGFSRVDNLSEDPALLAEQYGWTLDNGTEELFFPACGRRSWLRGLITNVNTMEVPKPWIGYYWTATPQGEEAEAMYFSLDTEDARLSELETQVALPRANGMQVRCVKE